MSHDVNGKKMLKHNTYVYFCMQQVKCSHGIKMRVNIAVCIRMQYHKCSIYADLTSVIHNRLITDFIAADPMLKFLFL